MSKRIAAITFILACASGAWLILGTTLYSRSYSSRVKLQPGVASVWGTAQEQRPPTANLQAPESSRVRVRLALDHRRKGLLWFSTYTVDFDGIYGFRNAAAEVQPFTFQFKFPAEQAVYDGLRMDVNGRPMSIVSDRQGAFVTAPVGPGETATLHVAYRSQGIGGWRYRLGDDVTQTRDLLLAVSTDFKQIDFPPGTLAPTQKRETASGWELTWRYQNLISGFRIGIAMPEKLQPGPLAAEISYFAPVSLLLFFFLIFIITTLRNIDLHPMNYFFLAAAFFSFHLLLAYLVDHISIHVAFLICSAVSVFLVVSYLRVVIGLRFAVVEAGTAQLIYLVLFSYAFFFEGFAGLTVTIGCIVTLFVVMQMTARIRWTERF